MLTAGELLYAHLQQVLGVLDLIGGAADVDDAVVRADLRSAFLTTQQRSGTIIIHHNLDSLPGHV